MGYTRTNTGKIKKAIAAVLCLTLTFGSLMLPNSMVRSQLTAASADTVEIDNCIFDYTIYNNETATITSITFTGDTVNVPSTVICEGKEYPVTEIGQAFLKDSDQIKKVVFPDSVKIISSDVLSHSSVKDIVLPDTLESLGSNFASHCPNLRSVKYNGTNIQPGKMGSSIFYESELSGVTNEKEAVVLGNWLIDYEPTTNVTAVKLTDLGNDGIKVENINRSAVSDIDSLEVIDLENIKYIGDFGVFNCDKISILKNSGSVEHVGTYAFLGSLWYNLMKKSHITKLGSVLMHYETESDVIDLTSGDLAGVKKIKQDAFHDCKNAETIICSSDTSFAQDSLYNFSEEDTVSDDYKYLLPLNCTNKVKSVILDGEELTYSRIIEDPVKCEWVRKNFYAFKDSVFIDKLVTDKVKKLFKQMDIPYCGGGAARPEYTPTEEFYIRLKIHNYVSLYDYDHESKYNNWITGFLLNGKCYCGSYADLTLFLLECAGIDAQTLGGNSHDWNNTKIGGEWFESDDGWDAQNNNHSYSWFGQSSQRICDRDSKFHAVQVVSNPGFTYTLQNNYTEHMIGMRTIGDVDSDTDRDKDDAALLWAYIKGETVSIDPKGADLNFDGNIDVTDAVLLEQFVSSKALDIDNVPTDGFAPTVKVAFICEKNYDDIRYLWTDREGYITLPDDVFEAPEGMKLRYDIGRVGKKVRITDPLTVVHVSIVDKNTPDYILGDVNDDGTIDIEDAVAIIQYINGVTPLDEEQELRADVTKDKNIDIDDAVTLISYINGNSII